MFESTGNVKRETLHATGYIAETDNGARPTENNGASQTAMIEQPSTHRYYNWLKVDLETFIHAATADVLTCASAFVQSLEVTFNQL